MRLLAKRTSRATFGVRAPRRRATKARRIHRGGRDEDEGGSSDDDNDEEDGVPTREGSTIFFYCDVNKRSVRRLVSLLREIECATSSADLALAWIFIHSDGGDIYAGISAMSHIRRFRGTVKTVVDGFVASAATLLLLAGEERYIVPHSQVLVHQLRTGFEGKFEDLIDECSNSMCLMRTLATIYETHTKLPQNMLDNNLKGERCLDELQCLNYELVHRVLK